MNSKIFTIQLGIIFLTFCSIITLTFSLSIQHPEVECVKPILIRGPLPDPIVKETFLDERIQSVAQLVYDIVQVDPSRILVAVFDKPESIVYLYNLNERKIEIQYRGFQNFLIGNCVFLVTKSLFLVSTDDDFIRLFTLTSSEPLLVLNVGFSIYSMLKFKTPIMKPDDFVMVFGGYRGEMRFIIANEENLIEELHQMQSDPQLENFGNVYSMALIDSEKGTFVTGTGDQFIQGWDFDTQELLFSFQNPDIVYFVEILKDGVVISTTKGGNILLWNYKEKSLIKLIENPEAQWIFNVINYNGNELIYSFPTKENSLMSYDIEKDQKTLIPIGGNHTLQIFAVHLMNDESNLKLVSSTSSGLLIVN